MSTIQGCRACGEKALKPVLSLGTTPLANSLLTADELGKPEPAFPLDLVFCPSCSLVQITETVPPEVLFKNYLYFSSFSDSMTKNMEELSGRVVKQRKLGAGSLVVELASNDGYLLQFYKKAGVPVLGIEPAENVAKVAEQERGIPTRAEFFTSALATSLKQEGLRADVIHANNVLAHVADLNGFVQGISTLLKDDGVAIIEAPYLGEMIEKVEFDTIYHEHLCYFSLTALHNLFRRHGLLIYNVEMLPIHGGSLRIFASPFLSAPPQSALTQGMLMRERESGMTGLDYYRDFAGRVERLGGQLNHMLRELKAQGKKIAAYGAAAKGSTLINCFRIGPDVIDFVVDRSTYKQGRFMPGQHIPIRDPKALLEEQPDYVLLLAWNFADEVMRQQSEYRARGGRFIHPVPTPRVLG